ncbi:MAG: 4Fe-4S ferredoxin [Candidatus Hydrothermarchaeota archaeon]|nr:MAG: 4Fe-4S ferredoxin [Candidatus Hydrothermarchaeota archaeon]RLG59998.1 MAG: 4Fe-4S ferredoxin [Candidatus Hydrothermarchaeota archaeon]
MAAPVVNEDMCTGCGSCVDACAQGVLELGDDGKSKVVNPDECVECCACVEACPEGAISHESC